MRTKTRLSVTLDSKPQSFNFTINLFQLSMSHSLTRCFVVKHSWFKDFISGCNGTNDLT